MKVLHPSYVILYILSASIHYSFIYIIDIKAREGSNKDNKVYIRKYYNLELVYNNITLINNSICEIVNNRYLVTC